MRGELAEYGDRLKQKHWYSTNRERESMGENKEREVGKGEGEKK